jgi:hypothetical protein
MELKPKEYYLCDDKDYLKKYGIIAQDVLNYPDINHLVFKDNEFIANIYCKGTYNNKIITCKNNIKGLIKINDIVKFLLTLDYKFNNEIIIDDYLYNNRYKKRYGTIKQIINEYSFEIFEDLQLTYKEKEEIFIYGTKVNDFNKLDYSSLYSLNIACTQELYKLIEENKLKLINLENKLNVL